VFVNIFFPSDNALHDLLSAKPTPLFTSKCGLADLMRLHKYHLVEPPKLLAATRFPLLFSSPLIFYLYCSFQSSMYALVNYSVSDMEHFDLPYVSYLI
jgi:hypothetical protein